mmetsp:Transcript_25960/g.51756  ORF Transcript_25960/g.51756 Transcript_25960/m.51756 type:complete len:220 (+) Transcript_25960:219-878(+)
MFIWRPTRRRQLPAAPRNYGGGGEPHRDAACVCPVYGGRRYIGGLVREEAEVAVRSAEGGSGGGKRPWREGTGAPDGGAGAAEENGTNSTVETYQRGTKQRPRDHFGHVLCRNGGPQHPRCDSARPVLDQRGVPVDAARTEGGTPGVLRRRHKREETAECGKNRHVGTVSVPLGTHGVPAVAGDHGVHGRRGVGDGGGSRTTCPVQVRRESVRGFCEGR